MFAVLCEQLLRHGSLKEEEKNTSYHLQGICS